MEIWGSWTFSKENKNLITEVLNKFTTRKCSDIPKTTVLSSLANSSKNIRIDNSSSSSDDSDIDSDFMAVGTCQNMKVPNIEYISICNRSNISLDKTFDSDLFLQSQTEPVKDHENTIKHIVELLNVGNYNIPDLCALLKNEQKNRRDISGIIEDVWPELVMDKARHRLCEVLVKMSVRPNVICEQIYVPWFKMCDSNLTGFIESLSKLIIHFPDYACRSFIIELLKDKESILVKHMDWLVEIMKPLNQQHWCTLLSEYMKCCNSLDQHQIPVLLHLVKNCQKSINNIEIERLVILCKNAAHEHTTNRDFVLFLVSIIKAIDLTKFQPEMKSICKHFKGASKVLIMKALENSK